MDIRPNVSVVMAVCDGQTHLNEAVNSVLSQTLTDFEFIIVDDGSTDMTPRLLDEFSEVDPRVRVFHRARRGLAESLSFGIAQARSELIARMDADDTCLPERLELQASYMHSHPEIGLLGTAVYLTDDSGADKGTWIPPADHFEIREELIMESQFAHSTVMFRKSTFDSIGGYRDMQYAQDYDLWLRFSAVDRVANLRRPLLIRRIPKSSFEAARETERLRFAWRARVDAIERGDYPRSALLRLIKPALSAKMPVGLRSAAHRIRHPRAA